jgi:hypothetical protein
MITKKRISEIIVEELHKILKSEDRTNLSENNNLNESKDYLEPKKTHNTFVLDIDTHKIVLGYNTKNIHMDNFFKIADEINNELRKLGIKPSDAKYFSIYELKEIGIDPMDEKNWSYGKLKEEHDHEVDKKYTHFLVDKETNKILDAWDYSDLDNESIKDYLKADIKDMRLKPNDVKLYTKSHLKSKGIDPFDEENWELS